MTKYFGKFAIAVLLVGCTVQKTEKALNSGGASGGPTTTNPFPITVSTQPGVVTTTTHAISTTSTTRATSTSSTTREASTTSTTRAASTTSTTRAASTTSTTRAASTTSTTRAASTTSTRTPGDPDCIPDEWDDCSDPDPGGGDDGGGDGSIIIKNPGGDGEPENPCPDYKAGSRNLYWGDLHVHTSFSHDAFGFGTRHDPDFAYRFARGRASVQNVMGNSQQTQPVPIDQALNFTAVTDHSEYLGERYLCYETSHSLYNSEMCKALRGSTVPKSLKLLKEFLIEMKQKFPGHTTQLKDDAWDKVIAAAQRANDRCKFTSFIGYEWTSGMKQGVRGTFHKNVIFKNRSVPSRVFDAVNPATNTENKLWNALQANCTDKDNCDVLTIPHNTNKSRGFAFAIDDDSLNSLRLRSKYEKLVEIFQGKGESECIGNDPEDLNLDCSFEKLPLEGKDTAFKVNPGFVREGLKKGLEFQNDEGVNPFQLGFVGGTDTHRANPGDVSEKKWGGNHGDGDSNPTQRFKKRRNNPGGLTGVWAQQNTRNSIFTALQERRVYATSGPRIRVEFFQSWSTDGADPCANNYPQRAPMGSEMGIPPRGAKPVFVVRATKDEANLERVDFVIGTYNSHSKKGEDTVVVKRPVGSNGKRYPNGTAYVCLSYKMENFNKEIPTFVYARVIEVPTPRWSSYDCKYLTECNQAQKNQLINERAWTSPIWNLP